MKKIVIIIGILIICIIGGLIAKGFIGELSRRADQKEILNKASVGSNNTENGSTTGTSKDNIVSGINYGSKTPDTVALNDEISIDTEKFLVIKNDGKKITAVPYYNIVSTLDNPIQYTGLDEYNYYIDFSQHSYWGEKKYDDIDMNNSDNNVQQYIEAYKKTLQSKGANNVETRIPRYRDLENLNGKQKSPGRGKYVVGSVFDKGSVYDSDLRYGTHIGGIRPLIEISI